MRRAAQHRFVRRAELFLACAALALATAGCPRALAEDSGLYGATTREYAVAAEPMLVLRDDARGKDLQLRVTWPDSDNPVPVIVWSHGATGTKDDYQPLIRHWASHGYVCIQANHSDSRALDKGSRVTGFRDWANRPQDVAFILDSLDEIAERIEGLQGRMDKSAVGVGGHSFGAHTAQLVGGVTTRTLSGRHHSHADERPRAFLLISPQGKGAMLEEESWRGFTQPAMTITGSNDWGRHGEAWTWRLDPFRYAPPQDKYLVTIDSAYHGFGGITGTMGYTNAGPDIPEQVSWVRSVSAAFWDAYLRDDKPAADFLLSGALGRLTYGAARITNREVSDVNPGRRLAPGHVSGDGSAWVGGDWVSGSLFNGPMTAEGPFVTVRDHSYVPGRMRRGGSWRNIAPNTRCGLRSARGPNFADSNNGFRVAAPAPAER